MELLELRKFFQEYDLLKLKHKLSNYFEGLDSSKKNEFIESVEFRFLPYYRSDITTTKETHSKSGLIQALANDGLEKVKFIEQWISEKKIINTTTKEDMFNRPFDGLFSVSPIKLNFSKPDLKEVIYYTNKSNSFDLQNHNIYDTDTKELIKLETQTTYNSDFLIRLSDMYSLDVKEFLNYHLEKTSNKDKYIDYLKYSALNSKIITHNGIKKCIKDWLGNIQKNESSSTSKEPQQEATLQQNKYHKIFSNDLGFTLFNEWYNQHKEDKNKLANFSFIYNALDLEKDSLIVCSQTDYINFLSQLDHPIIIDKVDSRQTGKDNKKYKLYESNKKRFKV